uniref:Uncharacterized protein n=1 Tax=Arundo donax TaxID=35708 RepID=A0A0A8ZBY2_ARUDO
MSHSGIDNPCPISIHLASEFRLYCAYMAFINLHRCRVQGSCLLQECLIA